MSDTTTMAAEGELVLVGAPSGEALISYGTPLTRLNYFDGKFLRADDLNREQGYLRSLVQLSNQGGGAGVVHGYTAELDGGQLVLSPGLALDPSGRVLLLQHEATIDLVDLIEKSREVASSATSEPAAMGESAFAPCTTVATAPPAVTTTFPTDVYVLVLCHTEALCGEEDVYGKLCEDACVTSTDRPYRKEGVMVRALPLVLCPPTCSATWLTSKHRRSLVASAYFATERGLLGRDMSGARLRLDVWCRGAAAEAGRCVPIGVVSVSGTTVEFLDAWTARRERIETPPRRYWAWQMMMRPWSVHLAQILQFQCHLHEVVAEPGGTPGAPDPCEPKTEALRKAVALLEEMEVSYQAAMTESESDVFRPDFLVRIEELKEEVSTALVDTSAPTGTRILIDGGIVELPAAGYLPVVVGAVDVNIQVRALLGDGVDLRFCVVRPDYVAHALEEAQHMERICLLRGIDHPDQKEEVDILVPFGAITEAPVLSGHYYESDLQITVPSGDILGGSTTDTADGTEEVLETDVAGAAPPPPPPPPPPAAPAAMQPAGMLAQPAAVAGATTSTLKGPHFRGAARSEVLSAGGGAFHFAGLLLQPVEKLVRGIATNYQRAYEGSDLRDTGGGLGGFDVSGLAGLAAMMGRRKAAVAQTPQQPALWMTLRCERDPFALAIGESTPLKLEAAAGASLMSYVLGGQLVLQGDLFCDESSSTATGKTVKGRAWGWAFAHARVESGGSEQTFNTDPSFIPVTAELLLEPDGAGAGTLAVTVTTQQGFEFTVTTEWEGTSIRAISRVTIDLIDTLRAVLLRKADTPEKQAAVEAFVKQLEEKRPELRAIEIANLRNVENPDVANDANPRHAAAARALRTIGAALADEGWQRAAERLLFPPPPEVREKRVLATRDWVLFHRRRSNSCDCCVPERKVIAPPRRYRMYEVTAGDDTSVADIREALARGEDIEQYSQVVGVLEFEGGTARLTSATDPTQIRQAWSLANPAGSIIYGAIASEGAALNDPDELDEQRIARAADLVRSITPVQASAPFDVLPLVPNGLSSQGLDGIVMLVTVPAGVQSHLVIGLSDTGMMDFVKRQIQLGELSEVIANNQDVLGGEREVRFEIGTDTVVDGSMAPVQAAWAAHWGTSPVGRAMVVLPSSNAIPAAVAEGQGEAIADALSGKLTEATMTSSEGVFGDHHAITILEPLQLDG